MTSEALSVGFFRRILYSVLTLLLFGSLYHAADLQVELGYAVVRNAATSMERCRRLDIATTNEQGIRQAHVAGDFGTSVGLLHQELLPDSSPSSKANDNLCWEACSILGRVGSD